MMNSNQSISSLQTKNTKFPKDVKTLFVYFPNYKIMRITISINSSLLILDNMFKLNLVYIYNGNIIDKKIPISKYNMINNTTIVSVSPSHQNVDKWLKITRNNDDFNNKIKMAINHENQLEISRLKDINFMKCEMKRRKFGCRKSISTISFSNNKQIYASSDRNNDENKLMTNYTQLNEPAYDPLPILW